MCLVKWEEEVLWVEFGVVWDVYVRVVFWFFLRLGCGMNVVGSC